MGDDSNIEIYRPTFLRQKEGGAILLSFGVPVHLDLRINNNRIFLLVLKIYSGAPTTIKNSNFNSNTIHNSVFWAACAMDLMSDTSTGKRPTLS